MPIETASYISDLQPSNPAGSDPVADGDNHIRLIKSVLKNTFGDITGKFPLTAAQFAGVCSQGMIVLWSGAANAIPSGWTLCNGVSVPATTTTGNVTPPDLRNRFIVGAGDTYAPGATGGAASVTPTTTSAGSHNHTTSMDVQGRHNHGGNTASTAITIDQMPQHNHDLGFSIIGLQNTTLGGPLVVFQASGNSQATYNRGGSQPHLHGVFDDGQHSHTITMGNAGDHNHQVTVATVPPYYALCYIMKT